MARPILFLGLLFPIAFTITGCLIQSEVAIKPDPKVDPKLEGVWQLTKTSDNDIGVQGYVIFARLEQDGSGIHKSTYKTFAFDHFERGESNKIPETFVSTIKHKGRNLMLVRLSDNEQKKMKEAGNERSWSRVFYKGGAPLKNWMLDYEFNKKGELVLHFWYIDNFKEMMKVHPMKFDTVNDSYSPVTLKGNEKELLDFYSDPKVRAHSEGMGTYQKLTAPNKRQKRAK